MESAIAILERIGVPQSECQRIIDFYRDDSEGLKQYVLYMRAILDDSHEYV